MLQEIYDKYYSGDEADFYAWYFTMEFSNNILMNIGMPNIIKGLNAVLDKATAVDASIPMMMSRLHPIIFHSAREPPLCSG